MIAPQTTRDLSKAPSKSTLVAAARILIESADDEDFPIAEIMLRNILIERGTAEGLSRLPKVSR